jgi:hypothetical protein
MRPDGPHTSTGMVTATDPAAGLPIATAARAGRAAGVTVARGVAVEGRADTAGLTGTGAEADPSRSAQQT